MKIRSDKKNTPHLYVTFYLVVEGSEEISNSSNSWCYCQPFLDVSHCRLHLSHFLITVWKIEKDIIITIIIIIIITIIIIVIIRNNIILDSFYRFIGSREICDSTPPRVYIN